MMKGSNQHNPLIRLIFSLVAVILAAILLTSFFYRFDLTSDNRYTMSDFTKERLRGLDDIVYIKVYLEGDLNIPFRKMRQGVKETLDEFKVYAGDNLQYDFINPFEDADPGVQEDIIQELYDQGLQPTNIISGDNEGGSAEKIVFPGALINYRGTELPLNLLKNDPLVSAEENIHNSIQSLEFEFIRVINSLSSDTTERIAFIEGHGELDEYQVYDITQELGWYFQVDRGEINGKAGILDEYKAIIVAKPRQPFNEQDKFVIDQYLMQGGKILWFLDMVNVSMDSLNSEGFTMALIDQYNIEDLLFRYGVRINPNLLQDIQCNIIPINMALPNNPPNFQPAPWYYFPLLTAPDSHPVTRNLNQLKTEFISDIDTIASRTGIEKTVLLTTSEFSRKVTVPALVSLEEIMAEPTSDRFAEQFLPVAVLLEGSFESAFTNRILDGIVTDSDYEFRETSEATGMLVVSDGDMIRNEVNRSAQGIEISPLGFDRYTQQTFGNKEFIVNALHYLTGNEDLINIRSREVTLRLLDKARLTEHETFWVLMNTVLPPLIIIIAGFVYVWYRKVRFAGSGSSAS